MSTTRLDVARHIRSRTATDGPITTRSGPSINSNIGAGARITVFAHALLQSHPDYYSTLARRSPFPAEVEERRGRIDAYIYAAGYLVAIHTTDEGWLVDSSTATDARATVTWQKYIAIVTDALDGKITGCEQRKPIPYRRAGNILAPAPEDPFAVAA